MEVSLLNPDTIGKGISELGFMVVTSAIYLCCSAVILFFFVKWFVNIINMIIGRQQRILDEILQLQKDQNQLLANIHSGMKPAA